MVPESGFVLGKSTPSVADFVLYDLAVAGNFASLEKMNFDITPFPKINRIVKKVGGFH